MKKTIKYIVNTTLFIMLWGLIFFPVMKYSIDMGATSLASIGGIIAIIISYRVVKRIIKSKLWSGLFAEAIVNKLVEENIEGKVTIS